ncbi:unnamed protein product [Somion occarium]|uniref:WSC domain-containing protein n=1 Tax=Somion occarium TaxID=3059160 RepID=A0ABP1D1R2_9APHY
MASFLSYVPIFAALAPNFIRASHISSPFVHRQHARADTLPAGWTAQGCITDNPGARSLTGSTFTDTQAMTVESCVNFCVSGGFVFAGLEFSQECYCGNNVVDGATNATSTDCNAACTGNSKEICGGASRLSLFWSGVQPPPPPQTVPSVGLWNSLGCYSDNVNGGRTLTVQTFPTGQTSAETCTDSCFNNGYPLAGMEFADECYCGLGFENGGAPTPLADCSMPCAGNSSEFCGGPNRLNVYNFTGTLPHGPTPPEGGGGGGGGDAPVFSVDDLPAPWEYAACYVDGAHGRVFPQELPDDPGLTVESCIESCSSQNYTLAGVEFSVQCFCGNTLVNGAVLGQEADCNMGCGGNATEACGGPNRLSVYTATGDVTALPVPVTQNTSLPTGWKYQGCLQDGGTRVFPYQIDMVTNATVEACIEQCATFGYPAVGIDPGFAPEADCNFPCSGDPIHLCGGPLRLSYYAFNSTLDTWHTPANTGRYEFLIGGLVVPLVATVGINGKVNFLEKLGTGFPNSTGAYELDLTLVNDFEHAWRELHVHSDVFCSGSIILPDKAARQLNVGGWSLESTYGVRLYWPDGSAGVNGTNDWEENYDELHLQRGRWYPSALVMANGSILVVGGEVGSNGAPEPSLEVLPTPAGGPTFLNMDWLQRTDPNNLYPFLHVLPSGNIFVGYYNEARILNPGTFDTITELPNMPGSVTSFLAGRTYPMEGTAVLLPQRAPYTDPLEILVCGGSNNGEALDNCVTIAPEVPNAAWTIERMPSKRVMPCMLCLMAPSSSLMAPNRVLLALVLLISPTSKHFCTILANRFTSAFRSLTPQSLLVFIILKLRLVRFLYFRLSCLHDPQTNNPDGTPKFPEEFRVEVYIPPYLNEGRTQPSFTITEIDWTYGSTHPITVTLHHGTTSTMRVSLVAATSSTHGNVMGGRTIFPEFHCTGNVCNIVAPPNANISPPGWHQLFILDGPTPSFSQFVRIGGDPGRLGEWPPFPDFTLPGV